MPVNETIERIVYEGVDRITAVSQSAASGIKEVRDALDTVKSALAAVGVTVGAGAMVALYMDTMRAVAAFDDMKAATGAGVEGLSAIQRVAKVGGHDFDGLSGQIGRMIKGLRDSTDEGTLAGRAFEAAGIKTRDANGRFRDTSEILVDLARKFTQYRDDGDRVSFVQAALGKGAEHYIPLLKDMAEGTDLHATTTTKQAEAANEAEKNIRRLTLAFEDSRRELVNEYTPALNTFLEKLLLAKQASGNLATGGFILGADMLLGDPNQIETRIRLIDGALERISKNQEKRQESWAEGLGITLAKVVSGTSESLLLAEKQYLQAVQKAQMGRAAKDPNSPFFEFGGQPELSAPRVEDDSKRQRELREAFIAAGNDRDKIQKALNPFYMTDEEKEKAGTAWIKSVLELRADVNAKIAAFQFSPTMDDDTRNPERDARSVALRQSLKNAEQLENEDFQRRIAQQQEFSDYELEALGGRQAVVEQMELEHAARLFQIRQQSMSDVNQLVLMGYRGQAAAVFQTMAMMTAGAAQHSRALFEINKIATIATIAVKAPEAIASSFAFGAKIGGPVLGGIMASIAAAAMFAQAAAAASAHFGGGSAPSIAGTTAAPPVSPVATEPAQAPQRPTSVFISLQGSTFDRQQVRDLVEVLNEEMRDGGRVIVQ